MPTAAPRYYVYALFRENGLPFYVGKGKDNRWTDHEYLARKGHPGHRSNLIRDMLSRNVEIPKVKLHEGLTEATAHKYEMALIAAIGRSPHGPLLNFTNGGEGTSGREITAAQLAIFRASPTAETRAKLSVAASRRTLSPTHKAAFSTFWTGKKHTAESIERMRVAQRARAAEISARSKGRKKPDGFGAKIAAAKLGTRASPETRAKISAAAVRREAARRLMQ